MLPLSLSRAFRSCGCQGRCAQHPHGVFLNSSEPMVLYKVIKTNYEVTSEPLASGVSQCWLLCLQAGLAGSGQVRLCPKPSPALCTPKLCSKVPLRCGEVLGTTKGGWVQPEGGVGYRKSIHLLALSCKCRAWRWTFLGNMAGTPLGWCPGLKGCQSAGGTLSITVTFWAPLWHPGHHCDT